MLILKGNSEKNITSIVLTSSIEIVPIIFPFTYMQYVHFGILLMGTDIEELSGKALGIHLNPSVTV